MSTRDLTRRLDRLRHGRPVDRGERIDPATLTNEQLDAVERAPRLSNGEIDFARMSEADLRQLAAIAG